jgi:hypothetical protein
MLPRSADVLTVDGRTNAVLFIDGLHGLPPEAQVTFALVTLEREDLAPIHPALSGLAVRVGDGRYSRGFLARDLMLRLQRWAAHTIYLRVTVRGREPIYRPLTVLWALSDGPIV